MKRRILSIVVAAAFMAAVSVTPAFGDAGAPGETFPEQPGTNLANGCIQIVTNPGTNPTGVAPSHWPEPAANILYPLLGDACFGG